MNFHWFQYYRKLWIWSLVQLFKFLDSFSHYMTSVSTILEKIMTRERKNFHDPSGNIVSIQRKYNDSPDYHRKNWKNIKIYVGNHINPMIQYWKFIRRNTTNIQKKKNCKIIRIFASEYSIQFFILRRSLVPRVDTFNLRYLFRDRERDPKHPTEKEIPV